MRSPGNRLPSASRRLPMYLLDSNGSTAGSALSQPVVMNWRNVSLFGRSERLFTRSAIGWSGPGAFLRSSASYALSASVITESMMPPDSSHSLRERL